MRPRIGQYKTLKVGDLYKGVPVKLVKTITGMQCPTRAYYDNGESIQNTDNVLRIVLSTGCIHYIKL